MFKKMLIGAGAILSLVVLLALPTIAHSLGVHPVYEEARDYSLPGKRALLITTSHGVLNAPGETGGDPTGVMASEFTTAKQPAAYERLMTGSGRSNAVGG
jgi:hypothetical protein